MMSFQAEGAEFELLMEKIVLMLRRYLSTWKILFQRNELELGRTIRKVQKNIL